MLYNRPSASMFAEKKKANFFLRLSFACVPSLGREENYCPKFLDFPRLNTFCLWADCWEWNTFFVLCQLPGSQLPFQIPQALLTSIPTSHLLAFISWFWTACLPWVTCSQNVLYILPQCASFTGESTWVIALEEVSLLNLECSPQPPSTALAISFLPHVFYTGREKASWGLCSREAPFKFSITQLANCTTFFSTCEHTEHKSLRQAWEPGGGDTVLMPPALNFIFLHMPLPTTTCIALLQFQVFCLGLFWDPNT